MVFNPALVELTTENLTVALKDAQDFWNMVNAHLAKIKAAETNEETTAAIDAYVTETHGNEAQRQLDALIIQLTPEALEKNPQWEHFLNEAHKLGGKYAEKQYGEWQTHKKQ